jgi:hypothetical protein
VTGTSQRRGLYGSVGPIVWLVAVAAFCWIAAHWIWRAFEPALVAAVPPPVGDFATAILSGPALGYARPAVQPLASAAAAVAVVDPKIRLMGIARVPGDRGGAASRALFRIDRRVLWLRAGDELDRGITLAAIDVDAVRIVANGRETRLPLREPRPKAAAKSTIPPGTPPAAAQQPPSAGAGDSCKLTGEQRARAYILRPEIIEGVVRERNGWTDLFKPAGVGLAVQNPGGTGAMLGLYGNDILTRADGAQLANLDDVVRLILEPLARNETVVVSGLRAGQPREWIYAGVNCLAR